MPLGHDRAGLWRKLPGYCVFRQEIEKLFTIVKQSVDARKKPDIWVQLRGGHLGIRQAGLQKEESWCAG